MNSIFSTNSKFLQFINKLFCSSWLNILWFVFSLPLITIGASTTALYDVSLKVVHNEEGHITQQFIQSFRSNFKKSTMIWLILSFIGIILSIDIYILYHIHSDSLFWTLCFALLIGACILYFIVLLNIFPLLARFDNTITSMFKNAFLIGIRYLFCSILMALTYFFIAYITINLFTPFIVFGQGLGTLICAWLISPILKKIEPNH